MAANPQLQSFRLLLELFQILPPEDRKLTFMKVAGYPHYENVCSNILAFYLKPGEDHRLDTLLLDCLLELHPKAVNLSAGDDIKVHREYSTSANQRIDLVIEADSYVIAIENKVRHRLDNDLNHYADTTQELCGDSKIPLCFVLAPTYQHAALKDGFHPITYQELWSKLESKLGHHIAAADPKWLPYLIDFIETTKNFTSASHMELTESDQFIIKHHEQVEHLNDARSHFYSKLSDQLRSLRDNMHQDEELDVVLVKKPWIYRSTTLVFDLIINDHAIAWDLLITPKGWELQGFCRDSNAEQALHEIINNWSHPDIPENMPLKNNRYILGCWPLNTPLDAVSERLTQLLKSFYAQANTNPS